MSDRDPAVTAWHDSLDEQMAASTSAIARQLSGQLEQLRRDYNAELAARVAAERERDALREVAQGNKRHVAELVVYVEEVEQARDAALAEVARLHALVVRGPGRYHLTDKGRAATDA